MHTTRRSRSPVCVSLIMYVTTCFERSTAELSYLASANAIPKSATRYIVWKYPAHIVCSVLARSTQNILTMCFNEAVLFNKHIAVSAILKDFIIIQSSKNQAYINASGNGDTYMMDILFNDGAHPDVPIGYHWRLTTEVLDRMNLHKTFWVLKNEERRLTVNIIIKKE